ncbi:hypothetical protein ABIE27_004607 [Paenibacillus sp. 4624]|uniref:hypothetical protein n=1 Tax=Paenibacillus sp. 4624 TaxID=3156453 RepID=UPI003D1EDCD5
MRDARVLARRCGFVQVWREIRLGLALEVCLNSIRGRMAVELYFSQKIYGLGVQAKVVNHEGNFIDFECKVHPYLAGAAVFEGVQ